MPIYDFEGVTSLDDVASTIVKINVLDTIINLECSLCDDLETELKKRNPTAALTVYGTSCDGDSRCTASVYGVIMEN